MMKYCFTINTNQYDVEVGDIIAGQVRVAVNGKSFDVAVEDFMAAGVGTAPAPAFRSTAATVQPPVTTAVTTGAKPVAATATGGVMTAPIPGLITDVRVKVGDAVRIGQCVAVMEAMKMENQLAAPVSGCVQEILVQKGAEVVTGQVIMRIG